MDAMNINRIEVTRKLVAADEEPAIILYAIDLALFNGENLEYSATADRKAKDLLVDVIVGVHDV